MILTCKYVYLKKREKKEENVKKKNSSIKFQIHS